jgi:alanine dehydrogenase
VHLFHIDSGKLFGIVDANLMGMVRTGAASGVATRWLAREDAAIVGQIGAGKQSVGQLEAVCTVRKIGQARIFIRTRDKLEAYCRTMSDKLGVDVVPAASAEAAVRGADILNIITKSATPVFNGDWLQPGTHINAAGSNALIRREIDETTVKKSDVVVVDSRETARRECGDLLPAIEKGLLQWETLPDLGDIVSGRRPGRTAASQITLYESHGMGIQDLYVATHLIAIARERGVGADFPIGA